MPEPRGTLELTWTNKHLALLSDEDGGYQWVDPTDHRVSEVRLLKDAGTVGETHADSGRVEDNLLIRGDALHALTSLTKLPEFADEYRGKVKLVYIDPPFNTGQAFTHYDDNLEHSVWLTMMRDRLVQIRELLAEDGSVWVHLDDDEAHRLKAVMDEVFGPDAFYATFIWQKVDSPNDNKVAVTPDHDFIHCYALSAAVDKFPQMPDESILSGYTHATDDGRRYRDRLLKKNGKNSLRTDRPSMWYPVTDPDGNAVLPIHDDGREACWALGRKAVQELVKSEKLVWKRRPALTGSGTRWVPYTREWAPAIPTRPWPSIWTDLHTTRQAKAHLREMFPGLDMFDTPKPELLMERIIQIASSPDDIVLDCFAGSGTTAAVAHKMGRKWIAVEWAESTLATFTIPRLTKVVRGEDLGGITSRNVRVPHPDLPNTLSEGDGRNAAKVMKAYFDEGLLGDLPEKELKAIQKKLRASDRATATQEVLWEGGGGFRILDVAESMFQEDEGIIYLADWASDEALAEPVAAQLGYEYKVDAPFCGRRGRRRLAVVDGVVSIGVVDILTSSLNEKESVVICGTAVAPDAREHLKRLFAGSRIRKIPASILAEYRITYRRRRVIELNIQDDPPVS